MQVAPDGLWSPERVEAIRPHLHESPFPAYHLATGDDRWKMTTDFMPLEDFRATRLYDSLRSWKVEMQMCALLGIVNQTAHAITVHRSSGRFEERDREILDALPPHLVTSYLNVMSFEGLGRSLKRFQCLMDQAPGAYGYLERDGTVGWMLRLENRPDERLPRYQALRRFSPRVNEVLRWMVEGKRNGEIAAILGINPRTVEKHVAVILENFGVENRATAIVRAMERYASEGRGG